MKYPASEKLEIIRLVEASHLPVKRTLAKIGVSRPAFYRWYDLYQRFGGAALEDRRSGPGRVWNRIPDTIRDQVLDMALERPVLSLRELVVTFTDERALLRVGGQRLPASAGSWPDHQPGLRGGEGGG